jgi:dihydropteroate synthase
MFEQRTLINCNGKLLKITSPLIMGILNITPNSFYDGGKNNTLNKALQHTEKMLSEGADIIDIGAISSKPGADTLTYNDERERLLAIIPGLVKQFPDTCFSIDTFRAEIAKEMVEKYGISIINDISAGELDAKMFVTIAQLNIPYIMMHMRGTPETMQKLTLYDNDIEIEILNYFSKKIQQLRLLGVNDIILDPGFGFSKTIEQNYHLLNKLETFKITGLPILVGISRKSMMYKLLDVSPDDVLPETTALHLQALIKGANILRVHDVEQAVRIKKIFNALNSIQ